MSAARKRTLSVKIGFMCALMFLDVLVALSPERKPIPPIQKTDSLREQSAVTIQQRTVCATRSGKSQNLSPARAFWMCWWLSVRKLSRCRCTFQELRLDCSGDNSATPKSAVCQPFLTTCYTAGRHKGSMLSGINSRFSLTLLLRLRAPAVPPNRSAFVSSFACAG
ncbi:MAG: hypothetical protein GY740_21185 [Gammaproteobacteria bacterium]|nr:hypothetical protein [Gammaproteobacteria bacterium]